MRDHGACQLIADIISAHGGELVGRIRIQKVVYLLDQLGLNSGFQYAYHHYGPYSSELSSALMDAQSSKLVGEMPRFRQSDGAAYSVYTAPANLNSDRVGSLSVKEISAAIDKLKDETATVLEIAATIHWLKAIEGFDDWGEELRLRKGSKAEEGRREKAVALLNSLGLSH